MPITIFSQIKDNWPSHVTVIDEVKSNQNLYSKGDVLLFPHAVDGIGLEAMESMACGMPVIATDGEPWNEIPNLKSIPAKITIETIQRKIDWYTCDSQALVDICKDLLGKDISHASEQARRWAETNSWKFKNKDFLKLVKWC